MKKLTLTALLLSVIGIVSAQPPVTSGLKLRLEAATGFNANGASAASWQDLSGSGNHLLSGNASTAEPVYNSNAAGSGFAGITFDGTSDYMFRTAASTSGFAGTSGTLFVVRIGNTAANTIGSTYPTTLSIGGNNSYNNEMALMGNWAIHTTSSGNWIRRNHQCYSSLPNNLPAIVTGVLNAGVTSSDIKYYVNGIIATNPDTTSNTPTSFTAVSRSLIVGARYDATPGNVQGGTFFPGHILEVLAYDRVLSAGEIDTVNEYLKCKYKINYVSCNVAPKCTPEIGCDDLCYWKVTGNNINNSNNIFGTLSNHDIEIQTNAQNRGIMTSYTGYFGWNTMTPTARLHVNCYGGNEASGMSDIRFENLEPGTGTLLAIDNNGYVFNTGQTLPTDGGSGGTFWNVTGNTITGGNNFLGTNSSDNVVMRTSNIDRGIWTSGMTASDPNDDGRFGWQTLNPTAHMHVNCAGGNPEGGSAGSDVRFEELESGVGNIVVIDDQGYIYNSHIRLNPDGSLEPMGIMKKHDGQTDRVEQLEKEVKELHKQLETLLAHNNGNDVINLTNDESRLYQNTPNPFGTTTAIDYYVHKMEQSAFIMIYDLNGRSLFKYAITEKGKGSIAVNAENMVAGVYMYSLVVDGREIDSKRMILTK